MSRRRATLASTHPNVARAPRNAWSYVANEPPWYAHAASHRQCAIATLSHMRGSASSIGRAIAQVTGASSAGAHEAGKIPWVPWEILPGPELASMIGTDHPAWVTNVERILVALDHSPGLEAIVDYACAIARGLGATVSLLHVYEPPNEMVGVVPGATVGGEAAAEQQ